MLCCAKVLEYSKRHFYIDLEELVLHDAGMKTRKYALTVPEDWAAKLDEEAQGKFMTSIDLIREKLGCGEVPRGRPVIPDEIRLHDAARRAERKTRLDIGLVLQEMELVAKGVKLTPGVGIEPQIYCAKRDLTKLGLWDINYKQLKLKGTPYEDLQPTYSSVPHFTPPKKDKGRGH